MYRHVVTIRPPGYPFAACFDHVAEAFAGAAGLEKVDFWPENGAEIPPDSVVIGAHLLQKYAIWGENCAIWNTEQVDQDSAWITPEYLTTCAENRLLDYDRVNVAAWRESYGLRADWAPLGYHESMECADWAPDPAGECVFYGSLNSRRMALLRAAEIAPKFGVFGAALAELLDGAACVLNLHFYKAGVFEMVRCSQLFANAMPVISEEPAGDFWQWSLPRGTFSRADEIGARVKARDFPCGEEQRARYRKLLLADILGDVL